MSVWIVMSNDNTWDGVVRELRGVFATQSLAEEYVRNQRTDGHIHFTIMYFEVQR